MRQKQKLIVTLWRGQLDNPVNYDSICCRMLYNNQEETSKHIHASKSLSWKETFVFSLAKFNANLKLDFINMQEIKEIHFAKDQILDSLAIGRSHVSIDLDHSNRGTIPAKLPIISQNDQQIGIVFFEYQILKTQVTYIVEKLMDYQYLLKIHTFKLTFIRPITTVPNFYLKFKFGERIHKEDFAFEQINGTYIYNYPVKLYIRFQTGVQIQLQIKDNYRKDYRNPNISFDTESVTSNGNSIRKSSIKKNQPIDLRSVDQLSCILDLNIKKDCNLHKKIPLNINVKGMIRQVAYLQFDLQTIFKTKKQKQQLEIQKKRSLELKSVISPESSKQIKKKQKYQPPKNGSIIVNSIIGKFELFNQSLMKDKDTSIQLKLGKVNQSSVLLDKPGLQMIWMDTFTFKRTWEQNIKFIVYLHDQALKVPKFYAQVNLRELFERGRYMAKKLEVRDDKNNYCGALTVDIIYQQEKEKPKPVETKKIQPQLSPQEKQQNLRSHKKKQIQQRMKKRQEEKLRRISEQQSSIPSFSQKQLYLPPLRPSRNSAQPKNLTLSPKHHLLRQSANIYNNAGQIFIGRSPRFQLQKPQSHDSFLFKPQSFFDRSKQKGAGIGYGKKLDFTKQLQYVPGAGRYEIPSVWDKYK